MLTKLYNLSVDILCVAKDEHFVYISPSAEKILGFTQAEMLSRPIQTFVYPDDIEKTTNELTRLKHESKPTLNFENRYICKDGSVKWISWAAQPQINGYIYAVGRDITEAKSILMNFISLEKQIAVTDAFKKNQKRFELSQQLAHVGNWELNLKTGEVIWSEEMYRIFDVEPGFESDPVAFLSIVHPDDRDRIGKKLQDVISGKRLQDYQEQYRIITKHGNLKHIRSLAEIVCDDNNELTVFYGCIQDVSEYVKAQNSLRQRQVELAHMARLSLAGEMVSGLAHELNQPLTAIVHYAGGTISKLHQHDFCSDLLPVLKKISSQAEYAGQVIHRLKAFLSKGQLALEYCQVCQIVEDALSLLEHELQNQSCLLNLDINSDLPKVKVDKVQIQQVILNIVHNALEAMQEAETTQKQISICARKHNRMVSIDIYNTGPEISDKLLEKIFDPFFTTKKTGMGLGLALCRSIIEGYGGSLTYRKKENKHGCFCISLPIQS